VLGTLLSTRNYVSQQMSKAMTKVLIARERFSYRAKDVFHYLLSCAMCRKK